jgi:hypothetical protein
MKNKLEKYETFCPLFPGFYGSVFEYDSEENEIEEYNRENGTNLGYDDFNWNYKEYHNRISNAFVVRLETEIKQFLPVKIEFQELISPREYNFANDSINISVELNLKQLIGLIKAKKDEATKYFKDKYTSCSGFISFHSNDYADWINPEYILEKPGHRIGALLDCLCNIEIDKDDIYYWTDSENWIDFSPKNEVTT